MLDIGVICGHVSEGTEVSFRGKFFLIFNTNPKIPWGLQFLYFWENVFYYR